MKTLTATSFILTLALSGSAFAININDTDPYVYLTSPHSDQVSRTGSQPEVGSMLQAVTIPHSSSNFCKENGKLLERQTNSTDYSDISEHTSGRTGSQPEVGSMALTGSLYSGTGNFWNQKELLTRINPLR